MSIEQIRKGVVAVFGKTVKPLFVESDTLESDVTGKKEKGGNEAK